MAFLGIPTSRKDVGNAGWLKGAATGGARLLGNVASISGEKASADRYRQFADAVEDPTKGYAGTLNPLKALASDKNGGSGNFAFTQAQPMSMMNTGGGGGGGNQNFDPGLGNGAYGTGAGSAYDEDADPAKIAAQRDRVRGLMQSFQEAFQDVLGKVDTLAAQKRGETEANYAGQQTALDGNYGQTTQGIDDQYAARNAFRSSYRDNAQSQAKDAYDQATNGLTTAKAGDLASIGQFADQQKAEFDASRPNYNLDDYNSVDDLQGIYQDVNDAVNKIRTTGAGLGTTGQYIQSLNKIAPQQEQGSAALKAQLDKLANVGTNSEAKRAIAATTIANAGGDPSVWQDYFEKQMSATGSQDPTQLAVA